MRISEFENEQALDVLAELIEPAVDIFSDQKVANAFRSGQYPKAVKYAIKNHKKGVIRILATLDGVPVKDYKCNLLSLPVKLLEILNDTDLINFLSLQGQTEETLGSATENTEGEEA